jgi:hypothetical protein
MPAQSCVFYFCAEAKALTPCTPVGQDRAKGQAATAEHKAMALALRCHCPDARFGPPAHKVKIDRVCSTHIDLLSREKGKAGGSLTAMDYALLLLPSASPCWFPRLLRSATLSFLGYDPTREMSPELMEVLEKASRALMQRPPSACSIDKMISLLADDSGGTAPSAAPTAGASTAGTAGATAAALAANTPPLPIVVYVLSPHDSCMSNCCPRAEFDSVRRVSGTRTLQPPASEQQMRGSSTLCVNLACVVVCRCSSWA